MRVSLRHFRYGASGDLLFGQAARLFAFGIGSARAAKSDKKAM
ncbi:MAG TPA: hypothetical protein DEB17_06900 [Chlorobaculum sp.]|uniref:Uncharacterized protein n=1 Tax=Chlorobaculum tepidum (strain ATCC 49652 / DSM 12025 / NBRC 103806 / TLS) TaxID=194439 RepID=Q8KFU3_CHLTE|nr:hypothetical protein CT0228 [Chlorobaculum tepidum TLS]HBU23701.1 hypothetical protein [Chlorobaculum sp.]